MSSHIINTSLAYTTLHLNKKWQKRFWHPNYILKLHTFDQAYAICEHKGLCELPTTAYAHTCLFRLVSFFVWSSMRYTELFLVFWCCSPRNAQLGWGSFDVSKAVQFNYLVIWLFLNLQTGDFTKVVNDGNTKSFVL